MAKAAKGKSLPPHLEELLTVLEAQEAPDRLAAIRAMEAKHDLQDFDLADAMAEFPAFAERYRRWYARFTIGLEDRAISSALSGKGSATTILRGLGKLSGKASGERRELSAAHAGAVDRYREW